MVSVKTDIVANQIKNSDTQSMIISIGVLSGIFLGINKGNKFLGIAMYGLIGGIAAALMAKLLSKFKNKSNG